VNKPYWQQTHRRYCYVAGVQLHSIPKHSGVMTRVSPSLRSLSQPRNQEIWEASCLWYFPLAWQLLGACAQASTCSYKREKNFSVKALLFENGSWNSWVMAWILLSRATEGPENHKLYDDMVQVSKKADTSPRSLGMTENCCCSWWWEEARLWKWAATSS